jgi:hypothetical protein
MWNQLMYETTLGKGARYARCSLTMFSSIVPLVWKQKTVVSLFCEIRSTRPIA